jgi:hypothetical protein
MLFTFITVLAIGGVFVRQTWLHYAAAKARAGNASEAATWSGYGKWLGPRMKSAFTKSAFQRTWTALSDWSKAHYPAWTKWIFAAFGLSVVYLAASGLFYAIFIPRGMSGFPLLGHMGFGGLFAPALAALLLWRGRAYAPDKGEAEAFERKILFWALAFFGFVLIASALGSMLPLFVFDAQRTFIGVHRYAALGLVLTAIVLIDITLVPSPKA